MFKSVQHLHIRFIKMQNSNEFVKMLNARFVKSLCKNKKDIMITWRNDS